VESKILKEIEKLKYNYSIGNYTSCEYHELLTELNHVAWAIDKWGLAKINPSEIQDVVHKYQTEI